MAEQIKHTFTMEQIKDFQNEMFGEKKLYYVINSKKNRIEFRFFVSNENEAKKTAKLYVESYTDDHDMSNYCVAMKI